MKWPGRSECLRRAREAVPAGLNKKTGAQKFKYYWRCATCREWYREESEMEVDHIVEVGPYTGDLHAYAAKMYCGQENLQALCVVCHMKKTSGYNSTLKYVRKPRP